MEIEGLPVVDAVTPLTFGVTQRDVDMGGVKAPEACAFALACKRKRHSSDVRVYLSVTYIKSRNCWIRYLTPHSMRTEIVAFDRGGTFSPGTYTLMPPGTARAVGARPKVRNPRGPRTRYHKTAGVRRSAR